MSFVFAQVGTGFGGVSKLILLCECGRKNESKFNFLAPHENGSYFYETNPIRSKLQLLQLFYQGLIKLSDSDKMVKELRYSHFKQKHVHFQTAVTPGGKQLWGRIRRAAVFVRCLKIRLIFSAAFILAAISASKIHQNRFRPDQFLSE